MASSYLELREKVEKKDKGLREKVKSLSQAVALIPDNVHVAIGGCHYSRTPMALIWEMIRQRKKGLTFSKSITATEGDLLLVAGATRHIITSWFSPGVTWGVSRIMRHYVQSGEAQYEEWSHMSLGLRYRAGAMGVPFLPARSMLGSDVSKRLGHIIKEMNCPFTGEKLALIPALNPDVAIIHVQRADPYGNAQIGGFPFMDKDIALAATTVILTAEEIIDNSEIRRVPDRTDIPFLCVDAVVEAPYGCLPHECYGVYEPDFNHMDMYVKLMMEKSFDGVNEYLDKYFYTPETFDDYLGLFPVKDILKATSGARMGHGG
ncbi:MAG: CoA transferase subunit A [Deltaproteobacteria bacterium]|nr:CoA transferase subunit A [Deltaproteobacteria bacterium]